MANTAKTEPRNQVTIREGDHVSAPLTLFDKPTDSVKERFSSSCLEQDITTLVGTVQAILLGGRYEVLWEVDKTVSIVSGSVLQLHTDFAVTVDEQAKPRRSLEHIATELKLKQESVDTNNASEISPSLTVPPTTDPADCTSKPTRNRRAKFREVNLVDIPPTTDPADCVAKPVRKRRAEFHEDNSASIQPTTDSGDCVAKPRRKQCVAEEHDDRDVPESDAINVESVLDALENCDVDGWLNADIFLSPPDDANCSDEDSGNFFIPNSFNK